MRFRTSLFVLVLMLLLTAACASPVGDDTISPEEWAELLKTQTPPPTVRPTVVPTPTAIQAPTQISKPVAAPALSPTPSSPSAPLGGVTTNSTATNSWIIVESQGVDHVIPGEEHDSYNTRPATSGWHFGAPVAPARWGIHTIPLPDEVLVHNLEHGYINVHYNCPDGCDELVAQLSELVNQATDLGAKVLMSPYPNMDTRIAMTAWTVIDKFNDFDELRMVEFIIAHESSPVSPEANVSR